MLSYENNELLCRVGPGTPMGRLMREYWIPALPSSEFPEPDCLPKRMRLLGENLVMFRDTEGRMGALAEACPHRGASLYFGRNEECGLRCAYHGWKFDIAGNCVDLPTEHDETRESFRRKIRARAFPCHEVNHMVWVYLGSRDAPPPFPAFEINLLPPEHVGHPSIMMEEANWLQNMEGDLDSAHLDWVHRRLRNDSPKPERGIRGFWNPSGKPPRLDVVKTEYGAYYTAKRPLPEGDEWHRINQFIFPFHTMITTGDGSVNLRSFVPLDDEYAMLMSHTGFPTRAMTVGEQAAYARRFEEVGGFVERTNDPRSYFLTRANKRNDYGRDLRTQQEAMICGIPFVGNLQDRAMTELMTNAAGEAIYDRSQEHLGTSDQMIITVRRQLLDAVIAHRDTGRAPANLDDVTHDRVRSASMRLPAGADWRALSETARQARPGTPPAAELGLIL